MGLSGWVARAALVVVLATAFVPTGGAAGVPPTPDSDDTLASGQTMPPGTYLESADGGFVLVMQEDGNLVEYRGDGLPFWDAGTGGHPGSSAILQPDGNLVVRSADGVPLWNAGTFTHPGASLIVQDDGNVVIYDPGHVARWASQQHPPATPYPWTYTLSNDEVLLPDDYLVYGDYRAVMQSDGNLVVYYGALARWSSRTDGHAGASLHMQTDGNLVIVDSGRGEPLWNTATFGSGASELRMQADGNLVLYGEDGGATWWRYRDGSARIDYLPGDPQYEVVEDQSCDPYPYATGFTGSHYGEGTRLVCTRIGNGNFDCKQP